MSGGGKERKERYLVHAKELLTQYNTILVVAADNVSATQLSTIRKNLRGKAVILMGKNTLMRKAIRDVMEANEDKQILANLLPRVAGNCGLVFTDGSVKDIRAALEAERKPAVAKAGVIAPSAVNIEPMQTSLGPQETSFFQALEIETKITRMKIEILTPVTLLQVGDKVTASQAELLRKLNITPFEYGLVTKAIYDNGDAYSAFLVDLTDEDVKAKLLSVIGEITAISLAINYPSLLWYHNIVYAAQKQIKDFLCISLATGYPTKMAVPITLSKTFTDLIKLSVAIDHFPKFNGQDTQATKYKEYQDNPELAAAAKAAAEAAAAAAAPKKEEKVEEVQEESSDDMALGGLF